MHRRLTKPKVIFGKILVLRGKKLSGVPKVLKADTRERGRKQAVSKIGGRLRYTRYIGFKQKFADIAL